MSVVVPALLAQTKEELASQVERIQSFAVRVHIDIMDGQFTSSKSVPPRDALWPPEWQVDMHLMYAQPESQVNILIDKKPSLVIFHAEAEGNLLEFMKKLQENGIKVGIALQRSTVPADNIELLEIADHALIFSGNLGEYGGKVNFLQLEKVRLIRAINPEIEIGWDGGANVDNSYTLSLGGVDVVNVGGALADAVDPVAVYKQLDFEVHRKDVFEKEAAKKKLLNGPSL